MCSKLCTYFLFSFGAIKIIVLVTLLVAIVKVLALVLLRCCLDKSSWPYMYDVIVSYAPVVHLQQSK